MFSSLLLFLQSFSCVFYFQTVWGWFLVHSNLMNYTPVTHLQTIITSIFTNLLSHPSVLTAWLKKVSCDSYVWLFLFSCLKFTMPVLCTYPTQIQPVLLLFCELLAFLCQHSVKKLHLINLCECACDYFMLVKLTCISLWFNHGQCWVVDSSLGPPILGVVGINVKEGSC